jgi:hypothetical protein
MKRLFAIHRVVPKGDFRFRPAYPQVPIIVSTPRGLQLRRFAHHPCQGSICPVPIGRFILITLTDEVQSRFVAVSKKFRYHNLTGNGSQPFFSRHLHIHES